MAELGLESWQIGFRIHAVYLLIQALDQNLDPSSWRSVSGFNKWVPTAILWSQFCQAAAIQNTLTSCPHKGTWVGPIKCSLTWNVPAHISLLSVLSCICDIEFTSFLFIDWLETLFVARSPFENKPRFSLGKAYSFSKYYVITHRL